MRYLYSPSTNCFYLKEDLKLYKASNNLPLDLVEASSEDFHQYAIKTAPEGKVRGWVDGKLTWVDRKVDASFVEAIWMEKELNRAREELEKVQDSDPSAIGSVTNWRDYRKSLRSWPESENFPNKAYRPTAPDA